MKTMIATTIFCSMLLCACEAGAQPNRPRRPQENGTRPLSPPGFQGGPGGPRGPGGPGGPPPPHPLMEALDADGDGTISAAEISAASEALERLDADGDGQLTGDELRPDFDGMRGPGANRADRPQRPDGRSERGERRRRGQRGALGEEDRPGPPRGERLNGPPGGPPGPDRRGRPSFDANDFADRILSFDKNDDGLVTSDELPKRMRAMIERGDTSGDGTLDRVEIEALASEKAP